MHPEDINAALRKTGNTQAMLADELEVARSSIHDVIHGRKRSARIQARIAEIIGRPVSEIWEESRRPPLRRTGSGRRVAA